MKKTAYMRAYALVIKESGNLVFKALFGPTFPHVKNIYEAILEAESIGAQCLVNALKQSDWSNIGQGEWTQSVVINKKKYSLELTEIAAPFYGTVPMCLAAYGE